MGALANNWGSELADSLDSAPVGVTRNQSDGFPDVSVERPDGDADRWIFRSNGGDWQHFVRYGWYRHENSLDVLEERDENHNDLRIGFYHRMDANRDTAVLDRELIFNFRSMGSNPTEFSDIYSSRFNSRKDEIRQLVSDTNGTLTGQKLTLITSRYDIDVTAHDDFFTAYTAALHEAFLDFVVENPELVTVLTDIFEDSIEEFN